MSKDPLKVVVRLLPPEITEEELLATINKTHLQAVKWRSFDAGKRYKGEAKPSVNSRCYFQFASLERAEEFIKDYHGHQFIDGHGEPFRAVACFAPYQKVPRPKPQKDPRDGTISDDPMYKEFLESLAQKVVYEAPPDFKALLKPADYGDTPLLNYMKTRSKERRSRLDKKEKRRWRDGGLEAISEEPKKAKWRCAECGTSKHLEEDPDDLGTFYCTYCWELWESHQAPMPKVKKKKKKSKEAEEGEFVEEEEAATKKKKKKKDKEPAEEDETERRRQRRKEKEKAREKDDAAEEDQDTGKSNRWRVKKSGAAEAGDSQDWDREKRSSTAKSRGSQDGWWEEDRYKRSDRKSDRSEKKTEYPAEEGHTRWKPKGSTSAAAPEDGAGEQEEKPRRNRKERKGEGAESGYWRPKS